MGKTAGTRIIFSLMSFLKLPKNNSRLYLYAYQATNLLFQLLLVPLLYRNVGLEDIGEFVVVLSVALIFVNFIAAGPAVIGVTKVSANGDAVSLSALFSFQFALAIVLSVIFFCFSFVFAKSIWLNLSIAIYVLSTGVATFWYFVSNDRYAEICASNIFSKSIFFLVLFLFGLSYETYVAGFVIEYFVFNATLLLCEKSFLYFGPKFSGSLLNSYLKIAIGRVGVFSVQQADRFVILALFGPAVVAVYNLIYKLFDVPAALLIQLSYSFAGGGKNRSQLRLVVFFAFSALFCLSFVFGFSDLVGRVLTGNKINFSEYSSVVCWISALVFIKPLIELNSFVLYFEKGRLTYPGIIQALCFLCGVAAVWVFSPALSESCFILFVAWLMPWCVFVFDSRVFGTRQILIFIFVVLYCIYGFFISRFLNEFFVKIFSIFFVAVISICLYQLETKNE